MSNIEIIIELQAISAFTPKPVSHDEISQFATIIERHVPDVTPERIREVIGLYATGKLTWNSFQKVQNITHPLTQIRYIECLDGFYEELPGKTYRYKGFERNEHEWSAFLQERWFEYKRLNKHSADAIWVQMVSGIRTMIKELETRVNDEFSHWEALEALREICKSTTEIENEK